MSPAAPDRPAPPRPPVAGAAPAAGPRRPGPGGDPRTGARPRGAPGSGRDPAADAPGRPPGPAVPPGAPWDPVAGPPGRAERHPPAGDGQARRRPAPPRQPREHGTADRLREHGAAAGSRERGTTDGAREHRAADGPGTGAGPAADGPPRAGAVAPPADRRTGAHASRPAAGPGPAAPPAERHGRTTGEHPAGATPARTGTGTGRRGAAPHPAADGAASPAPTRDRAPAGTARDPARRRTPDGRPARPRPPASGHGTDRAQGTGGTDHRTGAVHEDTGDTGEHRPSPGGRPAHGHAGHGHGHSPAPPAGRRVRTFVAALLVPCALATLAGLVLLWPSGGPAATLAASGSVLFDASVTASRPADCVEGSGEGGCDGLTILMGGGPLPGRQLTLVVTVEPGTPRFVVGDRVVVEWSGADPVDPGTYRIVDFQRGASLVWLAGLFALAVLVLGRWRGLAALAALGLSFVVLMLFVLPAILAGHDPLTVAVVGSCLIMFAVLYLTHGPSARTSTAVLGTLLSLGLIGALGAGFSAAAALTGLDDQTANLIATLGTGVDARGLLLAGVIIGALGVLDDVTVTQTSAVWELRQADPSMSARALFGAAMRIGRDHVASAVNTLVLAYAGAALPLMLLFEISGRGFGVVLTSQDVATEVVRTLVGSIGLVASVPITTALAVAVAVQEPAPR